MAHASLSALLVAPLPGCRSHAPDRRAAPTQTDRLAAAYEELREGGPFVIVADFENPTHMELFQLIGVSSSARCVLDTRGGRAATGRNCLRFTAGSPDDTIVVSNTGSREWYLKRDWRDYDLLMMSVRADRPGLGIDVQIGGGSGEHATAVHAPIDLEEGWNTIRLDLAEVAERVAIDDVRELRLRAIGTGEPIDLWLDDFLLTVHREQLLGEPRNDTGSLYVERAGRRWNIGAGGRFEITFANGQIVRWHNLAQDPYRLRNLVEGTALGPSPMAIGATDGGDAGFNALGSEVVVRSQLLEVNPVRVVLACDWRFQDDVDRPLLDRPYQRWEYTIYPTGQVFFTVECTARTPDWEASQLGLGVTVSTRPGDGLRTRTTSQAEQPPAYATARTDSTDMFLLFAL